MDYPAGTLGTLMELYSGVVDEFVAFLRELTPEQRSSAADFDGVRVTVPGIVRHIAEAGHNYASYARQAVRHAEYSRPAVANVPADPIEAVQSVLTRMESALDGFWQMPEEEIESLRIETYWGSTYSLDQLFEHAIVHILWHRRQIRRVLSRCAG